MGTGGHASNDNVPTFCFSTSTCPLSNTTLYLTESTLLLSTYIPSKPTTRSDGITITKFLKCTEISKKHSVQCTCVRLLALGNLIGSVLADQLFRQKKKEHRKGKCLIGQDLHLFESLLGQIFSGLDGSTTFTV